MAHKFLSSSEKMEVAAQRHPLKKVGKSEDLANLVSFLLNDSSSWMTGQILHLDGGLSNLKI
jgi:NAD(P)-dependent dehydrogenase (short-subunit alcohol dehydrogenase family)